MHRINARQQDPGTSKGFEAPHRSNDAFDRAMILLDDVVEGFALPRLDAGLVLRVVTVDRGCVGAILVDRDGLGFTMAIDCPFEKATRCSLISASHEQEVDCVTVSIDGAIEIRSAPADFDVRLVHAPALAHWKLPAAEGFSRDRQDLFGHSA